MSKAKKTTKRASAKRVKIHADVIAATTNTDRAEEAVAPAVIDAATPASKKAAKTPETPKAPKETQPRKPGILGIAAEVLAKTKKAMTAKEIVNHALENKLWETNGKTPGATLYAAMVRELATKGGESRFLRAETKGQFCASGK